MQTTFLLLLCIHSSFGERYGLNEFCPDHTIPEKSGENVKLCSRTKDCSKGFKCTETIQKHFGVSIKYCCQTRESICSLPPNPGFGECFVQTKLRYYFDTFELRCKPFKYFDCKGVNQNQFESMQECTRFCQSTACAAGESLLVSPSNKPVTCANSDACPEGYHCVYDSLFRRHVCCGRTRQEACPLGTLAYASPRNYLPLRCEHSSISDNCPHDFLCTGHAQKSFCCTPEHGICPLGQQPYEHPLSGRSMKCDPMRPVSECPSHFACNPAVPGASWGFCCSTKTKAQCPEGSKPFLEPITHQPVKCTVGVSMCGMGFSCESLTGSIIGFCCTKTKKSVKAKKLISELKSSNPFGGTYFAPQNVHSDSEKLGIDLGQEIEEEFETSTRSIPRRKTTKKPSIVSNYLNCPKNSRPVFYEGTQLAQECTPVEGLNNHCPEGSLCTPAEGDLYGRSVCCKFPPTTTVATTAARITVTTTQRSPPISPYFVYTVTSRSPSLKIETTSDPFCPSVISGRTYFRLLFHGNYWKYV